MLQNDNTKADTMLSDFQMIQLFDIESTMTCTSRSCRLAVVMRGTMLALLAKQLDRRTRVKILRVPRIVASALKN